MTTLAALHLPLFIDAHLHWFLAVAIVAVGLAVVGLGDVARIFTDGGLWRAWAISGVCFQESIRRRVLWMTPLAIVGVLVAVQLLNPIDDQDAIRETIKYALFTTGTLVVLATIILACTNLPREIDNRVIFTVVTKPTTRLEIILGKIIGFARVSATILLIMGVFTWLYAGSRAARFRAEAKVRLESMSKEDPARPSLEHSVREGLLESKSYARPVTYQEFIKPPQPNDTVRWMAGEGDQSMVVPFDLPDDLLPPNAASGSNGGLQVIGTLPYEPYDSVKNWANAGVHPTPFPGEIPDPDKYPTFRVYKSHSLPAVEVEVLGPSGYSLIAPNELSKGGHLTLSLKEPNKETSFVDIPAGGLDKLYKIPPEPAKRIYLRISGSGPFRYGAGRGAFKLHSPKLNRDITSPLAADGLPVWPEFHGRDFMGSQQLRAGSELDKTLIGSFSFRNASVPKSGPGLFELRTVIEGSSDDASAQETPTRVYLDLLNLKSGAQSETLAFNIESNRTTYFTFPANLLNGGDFDLHVRALAPGRFLVFRVGGATPSAEMVTANEPFWVNLLKSLLVMWMLSILVVVVSIFCSTFVSWPIAVVLTVVILMAHWGAQSIGDTSPGLGASMARDLGFRDPASSKVFGSTVEGLSSFLNILSKILPDISRFSATEDIERGVTITPTVLGDSAKVILAFGVPLTVLAYVFFKRKEVAP